MVAVSSIPLPVEGCLCSGCSKGRSGDSKGGILFNLFYRVYFASEKCSNAHL
jgi:hypothetical protein